MSFLIFNFSFLIYLYTMYPTISPYRDSGDMLVSAFTLGIAHPPGYPLYVLLGKIFTVLVPAGSIAYRVNLLSAFFGALSCSVLYFLIKNLYEKLFTDKKILKVFVCLFVVLQFCFSSSMHSLSIVSEMYSINAFFAVLIIYLFLLPSTFYLLPAFLFGLGLGNHQTLVLIVPGIIYLLIKRLGKTFLPSTFYLLPAFLLGFSIYLFLPIRSAQNPTANWGDPSASARNFYRVLTRADYGGVRLHPEKSPTEQNASTVAKNIFNFLKVSTEDISGNGYVFSNILKIAWIFGTLIYIYFVIDKKLFWTLFLLWFFSGPVFFVVSNLPLSDKTSLPILEPYLIMPSIIFMVWYSFALFYGYTVISKLLKVSEKIIIVLVFVGLSGLFLYRLPQLSKRYEFIGYDYSKDLLKTLPKNSVLFNPDDTTTFTLKYQQDCLQKRKDVKLAVFYKTLWGYQQLKKKYPEILPEYEIKSGIELEATLLSYNFERFPFYSDNISKIPPNYKITPRGILYSNSDISSSEKMFDFYILPPRTFGKKRFFTNQIINYYSAGYNNLGLVFNEKKLYNKSVPLFEKAISVDPSLSQAYNNLGVVYWEKMDYEKAVGYFSQALKNAPNDEGVKRNLFMAQEKIR